MNNENQKKTLIIDTDNFITCRLCLEMFSVIGGSHLKSKHNMTSKEYKLLFPNAPTINENERQKMINRISGKNNPNHESRTTEEERRSRSPFSKDFVNYKDDINDEQRQKFIDWALDGIVNSTHIEYYTRQGYTEEEAIKLRAERQSTFSLKICIEKHGEEEGRKVFTDRQVAWQETLAKNGNMKGGYSAVSQVIFNEIMTYYKGNIDNIFYATKNYEISLRKDVGICKYDITDKDKMKMIEYQGDLYHGNPELYKADDYPHPYKTWMTSEELWKEDELKRQAAVKNGFELLVIWEKDYLSDKKATIEKCLKFLDLS